MDSDERKDDSNSSREDARESDANLEFDREDAKRRVEKKTRRDLRDDWVVCPVCRSTRAKVVSRGRDPVSACPECGYNTRLTER
jgi:ssDNA-binding Zn-finger/Zn-ribbon topoisomerase 1